MPIETLDDRDASIKYAGRWGHAGVKEEVYGTTTFTLRAGSTITIPFTGTQISIYGTISYKGLRNPPSSTYSIDGGPPQTFNAVPADSILYRQLFFLSPELKPSAHTLVITSIVDNAYLWFDYAQIVVPPPQVSFTSSQSSTATTAARTSTSISVTSAASLTTSSSSSTTSSITSTSTSPSVTLALTPFPQQTSSSSNASSGPPVTSDAANSSSKDLAPDGSQATASSKPSTGVVAGAILGSLAVVTLVLFAIWVLRKRKRTHVKRPLMIQTDSEPPRSAPYHVTPFTLEPTGYAQGSMASTNGTSSHYHMPPAPGSESQSSATHSSHAVSPLQLPDPYGSSTNLYNHAVTEHVPGLQAASAPSPPFLEKGQIAHSQRASESFSNPPPVYEA